MNRASANSFKEFVLILLLIENVYRQNVCAEDYLIK